MEFRCHYCNEWFEDEDCEAHFENMHDQKNMTFESLKRRREVLGGLDVRDPQDALNEKERVFVTNNFQHRL